MDLQSKQSCLHSELPDGISYALVNVFRRRLLACSTTTGTLLCYIWSHTNGWEFFATPENNTLAAKMTSSVAIPNVGIWFFDVDGESLLLSEQTGDWDTGFTWTARGYACVVQISDVITAQIGGLTDTIDTYNWETLTESTNVASIYNNRYSHSCALIPKGINDHPTVAISK